MKKNKDIEKKAINSEKVYKKYQINKGNSSKINKVFDINDNQYNSILYSDMNLDNIEIRNNIKRTTIMHCLPSNDINQNLLKFNKIKIQSIKEKDLNIWKAILYNHNRIFSITQLNENIYYNDDSKIFNQGEPEQFNEFDEMDIISKDSIRTRNTETKVLNDFIKNLEALLRFFVKENKIQYKQGLNEIAGAFLLLKYSNVKIMTFSEVYNLFNGFFHLFVYNYYNDKTIYSIKNSLSLFQLLLKYHEPDIYNLFERSMLFPEVYGTSWILTVFAYKLNLNKLFYLWNKIILENDQLMIHYLMASLLIYKKNSFINLDEYSLPLALTKITIGSEKEIDVIFNNALNLRQQTPYSFRSFAFKLDVLKHKSNQHKIKYDLYHPDILISIPIFPSEICFICYKNIIKCPDENHIVSKTYNCEHCSMGVKKEINYNLFDLRLSDVNNSKNGILQHIIIIDQKELKEEDFIDKFKNKLEDVKNKYHFIFINTTSKNINDFNSNFNTSNIKNIRSNTSPIENKKKKLSQIEKNYEKEKDLLKKLTLFLIENNYKYISYAYGGFESIHNEIYNNKNKAYSQIKMLNHNEEKCEICKRNSKISKEKLRQSTEKPVNKFNFLKLSIKSKNQIKNNEENKKIEQFRPITINEVNQMISSTNYFAGPCNFVIDEKKDKNENQGLLIIHEKKLICIKTPTQNNKPMEIIQEIFLIKIKEYKVKAKLFYYIDFLNDKQNEDNIIIKFNSEIDSEKFIESFKKAKKEA